MDDESLDRIDDELREESYRDLARGPKMAFTRYAVYCTSDFAPLRLP
jgi:hypothetical protein